MQKAIVTATVESDLDAALNAYNAARYENAAALYKGALRDAPPAIANAIRINMALALSHIGNSREAREHLTQVIAAEPDNMLALLNLGFVYQEAGNNEEAISLYYRAVAIEPSRIGVWRNLGKALGQTYHFSDALKAYRQVLALQPEDGDARREIAYLLVALDQVDDALAEMQIHLTKVPNDYDGLVALSLIYLLKTQGRMSQRKRVTDIWYAFSALTKALYVAPNRPETWLVLGQAFRLLITILLFHPLIEILKFLIKR